MDSSILIKAVQQRRRLILSSFSVAQPFSFLGGLKISNILNKITFTEGWHGKFLDLSEFLKRIPLCFVNPLFI